MHENPPPSSHPVPTQRYILQFDRFSAFVEEYTSLLSLGGMFLKSEEPSEVGSTIAFDVKLADGYRLFQGAGDVVWVRRDTAGPGRESGMGVRFQALDEDGRELILKILEEQVKGGGEPFDVDEVPADALDAPAAALSPPPAVATPVVVPEPAAEVAPVGWETAPEPASGLRAIDDVGGDLSEEATLVTQRSHLGLGPSQGVDFASPWEQLPEEVPGGLLDESAAATPPGPATPSAAPPAAAAIDDLIGGEDPPLVTHPLAQSQAVVQRDDGATPGFESPFAMGPTDLTEFDELPELDAGDDLVLEADAEVQFDQTMAGQGASVEAASERPSYDGVEFETGPEMALDLAPSDGLEPPVAEAPPTAEGLSQQSPMVEGLSTAPWDVAASLASSEADPFATHPPPVAGDPGALQLPQLSATDPPADAIDGPSAPDPVIPMVPEFSDPIQPEPAHDATENLAPASVVEPTGPWTDSPEASVEGAAFGDHASFSAQASPPVEPTATVDMADAIHASPYAGEDLDVQDYDLDGPPARPGLAARLGKAKWLLASLALILLVVLGFSQRHLLGRWLGIDGAAGNATPAVASLPSRGSDAEFAADGDDGGGGDVTGDEGLTSDVSTADAGVLGDGASDGDSGALASSPGFDGDPSPGNDRGGATETAGADTLGASSTAPPSAATTLPPASGNRGGRSGGSAAGATATGVTTATEVVAIAARRGQGSTEVIVTFDGEISDRDVVHDALGYNPEREQIRLLGIGLPFRQGTVAVGTAELVQVRTGLHAAGDGTSELRLVFDLASSGLSVSDYRVLGDRLQITVR